MRALQLKNLDLVDVTADHLDELYEYDGLLAPAVLGMFGTSEAARQSAARLAEIRAPIEELVFNSELGQKCAPFQAATRCMVRQIHCLPVDLARSLRCSELAVFNADPFMHNDNTF